MKAYIAAPFFNPAQNERLELVKQTLKKMELDYFSPKDENLFKLGGDPVAVLDGNVTAIKECDLLVAITDDKDVGTIWECGAAHILNKPIIYIWFTRQPGQKFNLMLGASGHVVTTIEELIEMLSEVQVYDALRVRADLDLE